MLRSETADDPKRMAAAMRGLRAYQEATRPPAPAPLPAIARAGRAVIRDYGGSGPAVLFVPSIINPPDVLDLAPDRSLLRWLAQQGVRPLLLDWGAPLAGERDLDIAGHVETMLLPLINQLDGPVALAGYCLGGTMAIAAAQLRTVTGLALIATPWRFAAYPQASRAILRDVWAHAGATVDALGVLPMEVLQAVFWRMDTARTITKYEAHGARAADDPAAQAFVRLEDWANDGPPLTGAAARELFLDLFEQDLPGQGCWQVAGQAIAPDRLAMPVLEIASTTDHIVPAAAAAGIGTRIDLNVGHVGMIVGSRARAALWEPLAEWLTNLRFAR